MGISQIPTTTGTGKWVEIASSTPTSGTTVSFTSIAEYKDLAIIAYGINDGGTGAALTVRFNNDTGNNYSRNVHFYDATNQADRIVSSAKTTGLYGTSTSAAPGAFQLLIEGANEGLKVITGSIFDNQAFTSNGLWHSTDVINRIDVISSATYSAGTIKIFGRN